ncbi:MAG: NUDIX hydrolase [Fimbriimonadales bacterium]
MLHFCAVDPLHAQVLRWSERLRAIAQTGLAFRPHTYDEERYSEALRLAAEMQAFALTADAKELEVEWRASIGEGPRGYVTPQASVIAAVLNDHRELLLVHRPDSQRWFPPSGWADVGRTAAEVAAKEVREETGYRVRPIGLLGCFDSIAQGLSSFHFYCLFFECRLEGGELRRNDLEALDIGWFPRDGLPAPLHGGDWWVPVCFGPAEGPGFDPVPESILEEVWK